MYYYLTEPRLQLFFWTPNHCGAFLGVLSMLLSGITLSLFKRQKFLWGSLSAAATLVVFLGTAQTYSRGVWIAVPLACLFMFLRGVLLKKRREVLCYLLIPPVLFCIILLLLPHGARRLTSVTDVKKDLSVKNRFHIWRGGLGIIARHPVAGVGPPPAAGTYYAVYYQEHRTTAGTYTLVSDYLTLAASFGLPLFFCLVFFAGILVLVSLEISKEFSSPLILYAVIGIMVQLICSVFSTFFRFPEVFPPFLICVTIILFFSIKEHKEFKAKILVISGVFAGGLCLLLYFVGTWVNQRLPYIVQGEVEGFTVIPSKFQREIVILTSNPGQDVLLLGRPLARQKLKVRLIATEGGLRELGRLSGSLSSEDARNTILLATEPELALLAVALGKKIPFACVATANMPRHWPFEELSPQNAKKCRETITLPIDSADSQVEALITYLKTKKYL